MASSQDLEGEERAWLLDLAFLEIIDGATVSKLLNDKNIGPKTMEALMLAMFNKTMLARQKILACNIRNSKGTKDRLEHYKPSRVPLQIQAQGLSSRMKHNLLKETNSGANTSPTKGKRNGD